MIALRKRMRTRRPRARAGAAGAQSAATGAARSPSPRLTARPRYVAAQAEVGGLRQLPSAPKEGVVGPAAAAVSNRGQREEIPWAGATPSSSAQPVLDATSSPHQPWPSLQPTMRRNGAGRPAPPARRMRGRRSLLRKHTSQGRPSCSAGGSRSPLTPQLQAVRARTSQWETEAESPRMSVAEAEVELLAERGPIRARSTLAGAAVVVAAEGPHAGVLLPQGRVGVTQRAF